MKGGFYTPEMTRLTVTPEVLQKRGVTRKHRGGVKNLQVTQEARKTSIQMRVSLEREVFSESQEETDEASVTRLRVYVKLFVIK